MRLTEYHKKNDPIKPINKMTFSTLEKIHRLDKIVVIINKRFKKQFHIIKAINKRAEAAGARS